MRIIVEGPDGVGKSTLVKALADKFQCDILSMTELGSKNYYDYRDKSILDRIVSDRSFISEIVYSSVFGRKCELDSNQILTLYNDYVRDNGWRIIILDASTDTILKRIKNRGGEDPHKINNIDKLRVAYRMVASMLGIQIIDTEQNTIEDIVNFMEERR